MEIMITENQLAERQQRSVKTIRNQRVLGTGIPFCRLGRCIRYRLSDVEQWELARRFASTTEAETRRAK